jgi:hypothetical protein
MAGMLKQPELQMGDRNPLSWMSHLEMPHHRIWDCDIYLAEG